ncbi:MAG: hypothetical protein MPN21_24015 [Thermoanaerobaculia bacterium]|nr:hypothetical protein [Thermoanaerobaculia bacterium]
MRARNGFLVLIAVLIVSSAAVAQIGPADQKNPTVVERGRGWQLLEIWGPDDDKNLPGIEVWMVQRKGVRHLPVSSFVRDGIRDSFDLADANFGEDKKRVLYHHKHLWELVEDDPSSIPHHYPDLPLGCFGWETKHKRGSVDRAIDPEERTFDLFGGLTGQLTVDIPVTLSGTYDVKYRVWLSVPRSGSNSFPFGCKARSSSWEPAMRAPLSKSPDIGSASGRSPIRRLRTSTSMSLGSR